MNRVAALWLALSSVAFTPTHASPATPLAAAAAADTPRVVRQLEPIVVEAERRSDPGSIETVYPVRSSLLRTLPLDRLIDAIALEPGVVAVGEELHVRGGRAGELALTVLGLPLNDPQFGGPMELPLLAVRSAELLEGGVDAEHRGALAGELDVRTETPTARPTWIARGITDGRRYGNYDAGLVRLTGPLGVDGLGIAAAGEARLDDLGLPSTRTRTRHEWLGANLGWRQDNHLLGWMKVGPIDHPQRGSIEVFGSRAVRVPYDPMFTFDGWVTPVENGDLHFPYALSDVPLDSTSIRYRAGDHVVMTDERRVAVLATQAFAPESGHPWRASVGWLRSTSRTSLGLRHDLDYTLDPNHPLWGPYGSAAADPFHAYLGDEPYFRTTDAERWLARADVTVSPGPAQRLKAGGGVSYDHVRFTELDDAAEVFKIDSLRTYQAFAPGGFAYAQHRWESGGLVLNAGLRLEAFTAGPQAHASHTWWTWSPRLGFAYPVSVRDAFSLSYTRIHQEPQRDVLYENRTFGYATHPMGNGLVEPAEMISYQAAIKHVLDPRWSLQLGVFYRDFSGEPGARNRPVPSQSFRLEYQSADDGHAEGVDLSAQFTPAQGRHLELAYTFMNAWGTQSNVNGLSFGQPVGERPLPLAAHPLDWDQHHLLTALVSWRTPREWTFVWSTQIGSGFPWTPLPSDPGDEPAPYLDQRLINSRRLPWNENTDVSARWSPPFLFGASALLRVTNLFDNRAARLVTLSGYPNPIINTVEDDYSAYFTETGRPGGAYFDPRGAGSGSPAWIPEHDPRLGTRPRSIRIGVEIGR